MAESPAGHSRDVTEMRERLDSELELWGEGNKAGILWIRKILTTMGIYERWWQLATIAKSDRQATVKFVREYWRETKSTTMLLVAEWQKDGDTHMFGLAIHAKQEKTYSITTNHILYDNPAGCYGYFLISGIRRPFVVQDPLPLGKEVLGDLLYFWDAYQSVDVPKTLSGFIRGSVNYARRGSASRIVSNLERADIESPVDELLAVDEDDDDSSDWDEFEYPTVDHSGDDCRQIPDSSDLWEGGDEGIHHHGGGD